MIIVLKGVSRGFTKNDGDVTIWMALALKYLPDDTLAVSYRLVRFALTFLPLSN